MSFQRNTVREPIVRLSRSWPPDRHPLAAQRAPQLRQPIVDPAVDPRRRDDKIARQPLKGSIHDNRRSEMYPKGGSH